jgi:putative transcriptional regulator
VGKPGQVGPARKKISDTALTSILDRVTNRVRVLREQRGISQGELAAEVGVSRQTINSIEVERYTPSLPLALKLARYFGSTVEEVFG